MKRMKGEEYYDNSEIERFQENKKIMFIQYLILFVRSFVCSFLLLFPSLFTL